jgi:hypothetical protein
VAAQLPFREEHTRLDLVNVLQDRFFSGSEKSDGSEAPLVTVEF